MYDCDINMSIKIISLLTKNGGLNLCKYYEMKKSANT